LRVAARAQDSFLAEMVRLMEVAESGRTRYRRLADRAARLYSPVVHATAFLTFLGWMVATGDWHRAIGVAIAVLIITCPCALGLAVPIVQVVAARRLFENGIMVKDGSGLERLTTVDAVAFDKTGTLTVGRPTLTRTHIVAPEAMGFAVALAARSRHPSSQALARTEGVSPAADLSDITELPGLGMEGRSGSSLYRLGRASWALGEGQAQYGTVLSKDGVLLAGFTFEDTPRSGATETVAALRDAGFGRSGRKSRHCRSSRRPASGRQARSAGAAENQRAPCVDGWRRFERCAGPCRRPCLDGASQCRRYRKKCGGFRFPA
jgi:Cu2+-exporting ATPase